MTTVDVDVAELAQLAADLLHEDRRLVQRRVYKALDQAIDFLYAEAHASALAIRDTGALAASLRHESRGGGDGRRVWTEDPAGLMNEFGTHSMAPRPWLFPHAQPAGDLLARLIVDGTGEVLQ